MIGVALRRAPNRLPLGEDGRPQPEAVERLDDPHRRRTGADEPTEQASRLSIPWGRDRRQLGQVDEGVASQAQPTFGGGHGQAKHAGEVPLGVIDHRCGPPSSRRYVAFSLRGHVATLLYQRRSVGGPCPTGVAHPVPLPHQHHLVGHPNHLACEIGVIPQHDVGTGLAAAVAGELRPQVIDHPRHLARSGRDRPGQVVGRRVSQPLGHGGLLLEHQAVTGPSGHPVQLRPHRPQHLLGLIDQAPHLAGQRRPKRLDPAERVDVAQPASALLQVGLEFVGNLTAASVTLFGPIHQAPHPLRPETGALALGCGLQSIGDRPIARQVAQAEQRCRGVEVGIGQLEESPDAA